MLEGLRILWRRDIRWLVLIPLLINIVLFASATGFVASWLQNWITTITTSVPEWLQWLAWIIWLLFAILALAIYAFTFTILANLIGSPFYGVIAKRVIAAEAANNSIVLTEEGLISGAWNSVVRELQLIGYFLPRTLVIGIATVILSFIPVANLLAPIIAGTWAAWCLCLQYLDYAADSQGVTFLELREKVSGNRLNSMGFGASAMLASAIPLLNLLMLPASVVAGSLLWCRQHNDVI